MITQAARTIAYATPQVLNTSFGSISAINAQQNLAILSQGNSMDPFSVTKKDKRKKRSGYAPKTMYTHPFQHALRC